MNTNYLITAFYSIFDFLTRFCLKHLLFLNFIFLFSFSTQARENNITPPLSRGAKVFFTEIHTGYYYTEKNYTELFKSQSLNKFLNLKGNYSLPFFQYMSMDLSLGYAFTDWFEAEVFSSGFWFAQSGDGKKLRFNNPQIKRVGAAFRSQQSIALNSFGLIPEFSFSVPFFSVNFHSDKPITDDGSLHFTPSIWMYGSISNIFYPFIHTGIKLRTQSLSSFLLWKLGAMLKGNIAEIGAYSYGFWSILRDKSSSRLGDRSQFLKKVNAGSMKFFSSNPGLIGFTAWLGWHFPYVTLRLAGDIDINGIYHSKGYSFLASLIIDLGSDQREADEIFDNETDSHETFEPQISEEEQTVSDIFENPAEDIRIQQEAEQALKEVEKIEEENIEQEPINEESPNEPNEPIY